MVLTVLGLHALALWTLQASPPLPVTAQLIPVTLLAQAPVALNPPPVEPRKTIEAAPVQSAARAPEGPVAAPAVVSKRPEAAAPRQATPEPNERPQRPASAPVAPPAAGPDDGSAKIALAASATPAASTAQAPAPGSDTKARPGTESAEPGGLAGPVALPSSTGAYLSNPPPPYPPMSRRLGEQGKVTLRALIAPDGRARQVEVLRSSGYDRLDQAALQAARDWRYQPGTRAGQPEAMWFNLPVVFELN